MSNHTNFSQVDEVCDHLAQLAQKRDAEQESFRTLSDIITDTNLPYTNGTNTHYENGVLTEGRAKDSYGRGTSAFRNYVSTDSHGTACSIQVQETLVHDVASTEKRSIYHTHLGYEVNPTSTHEFYNGVNVKAERLSPGHHLDSSKVRTEYETMAKDPLDILVHPWRENQGGSADIQRQAREAEKEAQEKAAERQANFRKVTEAEVQRDLLYLDATRKSEITSTDLAHDLAREIAKEFGLKYENMLPTMKVKIDKLAATKAASIQSTVKAEKEQQARDEAKAKKEAVWIKLRDEKEAQAKREAHEKAERDKQLEAKRLLAREKLEEQQREIQRQAEERARLIRERAAREMALKAQQEREAQLRQQEEKREHERLMREQKAEYERNLEMQRQREREEQERHEKAERERRENELREERERQREEERLERERLEQERREEQRRYEEEQEAENMQSTCSWYYHGRCLKGHNSCLHCGDYDTSEHSCANCSHFDSCPGSNRKGDSWNGICNAYGGNPIRDDPSSHTCKAWS